MEGWKKYVCQIQRSLPALFITITNSRAVQGSPEETLEGPQRRMQDPTVTALSSEVMKEERRPRWAWKKNDFGSTGGKEFSIGTAPRGNRGHTGRDNDPERTPHGRGPAAVDQTRLFGMPQRAHSG